MSVTIDAVWPGQPYPRGATWDGMGVNFALFPSRRARRAVPVRPSGRHELQRVRLREQTDQVWHAYLPQARPGHAVRLPRARPYRPREGHRFNPHKLLLDPYARNIVGTLRWHDALFGYRIGHDERDLSFDRRDSAPYMPRCKVIDTAFSWGDDRRRACRGTRP
jgi:isoamylase